MLPTAFENFDPLKGETPDFLDFHYSRIMKRAREILKARSHDEILAIAQVIDWLSDGATLWEDAFDMLGEKAVKIDADEDIEGDYPEGIGAEEISFYIDKIELDDNEYIKDLTWPEIFAVLALQNVSVSIDEQVYQAKGEWKPDNSRFFSVLGFSALEAMEAICKAEALIDVQRGQESTLQKVKKKTSLKAQHNVFEKHKKYNAIYKKLVTFYRKGSFKNYTECVEAFLKVTPEEDVRFLKKTNRANKLKTVLSELLRGIRTLPESAEDYKK